MFRRLSCAWLVAGLLSVALPSASVPQAAQAGHPDLFYNFYVGPAHGPYPGVPAQLYISPRPTPPLVGHTYITYQPLLPHEFLYRHGRTYYRYYHNGGHSVTHVYWH